MALGVVLIVLDLALPIILATSGYWDHEYVETYRGYDIYFFPEPNVYGVDTLGTNPPGEDGSWRFFSESNTRTGLENARAAIDNWVDNPVYVESYNGYDIYREPAGVQRYYGVSKDTGERTSYWTDLSGLKRYIDGPQGYFTVNGLKPKKDDTIVVPPTSVTIVFNCTESPDLVNRVYITIQETDGAYASEVALKKVDTRWEETVNLPEDGAYMIEGYMERDLETVRLLSVTISTYGTTGFLGLLTCAGASVAVVGLVIEVYERSKSHGR